MAQKEFNKLKPIDWVNIQGVLTSFIRKTQLLDDLSQEDLDVIANVIRTHDKVRDIIHAMKITDEGEN